MEFVKKIGFYRDAYMGVAMISVVLYHMCCWVTGCHGLSVFVNGFIGVDIFILLSGFGLCYSYNKNSIGKFYANRLWRIFPLHIFSKVLAMLWLSMLAMKLTGVKSCFLGSSTLSYYVPGCNHGDWFVPAIVLLYVLFPLIYKFVQKVGCKGVLLFTAVMFLYAYKIADSIGWYYDCLFSRLPAFMLGILLYLYVEKKIEISGLEIVSWVLLCVVSASYDTSRFYRATLFCPAFMIGLSSLFGYAKIKRFLDFIGKHSFELYLGHSFMYGIIRPYGLYDMRLGGGNMLYNRIDPRISSLLLRE